MADDTAEHADAVKRTRNESTPAAAPMATDPAGPSSHSASQTWRAANKPNAAGAAGAGPSAAPDSGQAQHSDGLSQSLDDFKSGVSHLQVHWLSLLVQSPNCCMHPLGPCLALHCAHAHGTGCHPSGMGNVCSSVVVIACAHVATDGWCMQMLLCMLATAQQLGCCMCQRMHAHITSYC